MATARRQRPASHLPAIQLNLSVPRKAGPSMRKIPLVPAPEVPPERADAYWGILEVLSRMPQSIAISGHTSPDGDALGSTLGLGLALRERFPNKEIAFLMADDAPVPHSTVFSPVPKS